MALSKAEKLARCAGCRDDFYNGHNPMGVKECWGLKTAKSVERVSVGTWQEPPYQWVPQKTLSCHKPEGRHWLRREDVRVLADEDYKRVTATPESREQWLRTP